MALAVPTNAALGFRPGAGLAIGDNTALVSGNAQMTPIIFASVCSSRRNNSAGGSKSGAVTRPNS